MKNALIIFTFFLIFASKISLGQIAFSSKDYGPKYVNANALSIGDVNNDGLNDIVMVSDNSDYDEYDFKIFVYIQDSIGNLKEPDIYSYSKSIKNWETFIEIADINNDSKNEIIVNNGDSICIFSQNSTGKLNSGKEYFAGGYIDGLKTGDINNDGLTDIVLSLGNHNINVLYQETNDNFVLSLYPAPIGLYNQVEVNDINNDGLNDVVLMSIYNCSDFYIYKQNNFGTLDEYITYTDTLVNYCFAINDLNNDGLNDIVKTIFNDNKLAIYLQDKNTHELIFSYLLNTYYVPELIKVEDLNCDGKNEIIVIHSNADISVFEQNTNNEYDLYTHFDVQGQGHFSNIDGFSIGDINNDGKIDVVTANSVWGLVVSLNLSTPKMPQIIGSTKVCEENEISSYQTSFDFNGTITWNLYPLEAGTIINSTTKTCEIAWNNDFRGEIELYLIGTNDCSTGYSESFFIIDSRLPKLDLGADKILCTNSELLLHANTDFTSYKWNDNSTDTTLLVKVDGEYFVEAEHFCGIAHDTVKVIEKQPQINLPEDPTLCKGANILFDVSLAGNNQYLWQNGSQFPIYNVTNAGVYSVTITDEYNCKNEKTVVVKEITPPVWKLPTDTSFCVGNILTLDVLCEDCNYIWQDASILPQFEITETGIYSVEVYNFCDTISKSINANALDCDTYLAVPSAFSPNNDNNNDELFAVGKNIEIINFKIFDRWGNIVFETTDINKGWDGTYKGKKLDANVFMYFATAKSVIDGKTLQTQGNVSLIR